MVVANVELRFLWLALATAILVATVVVMRRRQMEETARKAARRRAHADKNLAACHHNHG